MVNMSRKRIKWSVTNVTVSKLVEKKRSAQIALDEADKELKEERKKCDHRYIPYDPYDPKDQWFSSSCFCPTCGLEGSTWWCPESKSGLCDYNQSDGTYDEDNCIHCGMPEERK